MRSELKLFKEGDYLLLEINRISRIEKILSITKAGNYKTKNYTINKKGVLGALAPLLLQAPLKKYLNKKLLTYVRFGKIKIF